ncbi:NAD(P)-dependent oxidoreductase [Dyadobacter sp. CY312]|uniref:NAD(P)-dependent oxidoreductase n=1 Tax=Dyadobacter sp. CY312 TaxID=2907303 RepID=UPI001F262852|nr:NAD(P)H-binding protein [Dyadobacter sp. CY312]MCE7041697.1 NAD(P)H-binding protein [Dyadobacter sp. CY312]
MKTYHKIAVIGGGGRTGKYLVDQLLDRGFQIKLLLRNPEISNQNLPLPNPAIQVVEGDVLNYEAVYALIEGCDAVISTVGQRKDEPLVASQATANILKAMSETAESENAAKRYILVAGLNVDTPFDKKGAETLVATEWMKTNFPVIHEDRQKAYEVLQKSDADWTLVRVPYIVFTDELSEIGVSLEDAPGQKISAASIAGFLIDQLSDENYIRKAPFIANI